MDIKEIVLIVEHRTTGGDKLCTIVSDGGETGKIVSVFQNGVKREPKDTSFDNAVKFIMNETDLLPPETKWISPAGHLRLRRYVYRQPDVYVQSALGKWACAYPRDGAWWVKKRGDPIETRFRTATEARAAVDYYIGYDYLSELRKDGMTGKQEGIRRQK